MKEKLHKKQKRERGDFDSRFWIKKGKLEMRQKKSGKTFCEICVSFIIINNASLTHEDLNSRKHVVKNLSPSELKTAEVNYV